MAAAAFDPMHFPVPNDVHKAGNIFLGVTIPLFVTSITTLSARIGFKLRSGVALGWEDYLIVVGFLLSTVDWALLTVSIAWSADYNLHFTPWATLQRGFKLGILAIPIWGFAVGLIKLSVACLLLRFQQNRAWRLFLYFIIALVVAVTVASGIFISLNCIPLAASWDPTHHIGARCVSSETVRLVSNFVGGFHITTDIVLSLFPLTFLATLRRPLIEKVLISILMGIGLTASAASITKAIYVGKWAHNPSSLYLAYMISTFTTAEMLIGSTAACLPCLKSPIQKLLAKCGIDFDHQFSNSLFWRSWGFTSRGPREESISEHQGRWKESGDEKESSGKESSGKGSSGKGSNIEQGIV